MRAKIGALWVVLVVLGLLSLLWLVLIARGEGLEWDWGISILVSWWMTLAFAAAATVYAAGRLRFLMGAALASACAVIATLFFGSNDGPGWLLWGFWLGAAAIAQAGLLLLLPLRWPLSRILRVITFIALAVMCLAFYLETAEFIDLTAEHEWQERLAAIACVVNTMGTIALYLLAAIEHLRRPAPESLPPTITLSAACPRCNTMCTFGQGTSSCCSCGLRIMLDIEEPRCECGYLLYKLNSERCPECGRLVRRPAIAAVHA